MVKERITFGDDLLKVQIKELKKENKKLKDRIHHYEVIVDDNLRAYQNKCALDNHFKESIEAQRKAESIIRSESQKQRRQLEHIEKHKNTMVEGWNRFDSKK